MSDLTTQMADQLDYHWTNQLRPRLEGLTDEEYFWQPVPDCWTVHPDGAIDFIFPQPQPAPFTTIAWRLAHVIVGVLAMRNHFHFGGPPADYQSWNYATDAKTALQQLDGAYANWITAVRGLDTEALNAAHRAQRRPVGGPRDVGTYSAHQPGGHPPRRRNRLHPRSLRTHRKRGKVAMPGMPPPASDERQTLLEFLRFNQNAFFAVAYGLADEQARSKPSVSALSIGGLIKHATGVQKSWAQRAASAPDSPPRDDRPIEEIMAEYADQYVMRDDETLAQLLGELRKQNEETLRVIADADLDTPVPVPHDVPWFPQDVDHWSVRWVALHLIEELTRHAGHADIIRESIDGATMYELMAANEEWPETDWMKRWKPALSS